MWFMIALLVLLSGQQKIYMLTWTSLSLLRQISVFMLMGVHDCFIGPSLRLTKKVHNKMNFVVVVRDKFLRNPVIYSFKNVREFKHFHDFGDFDFFFTYRAYRIQILMNFSNKGLCAR